MLLFSFQLLNLSLSESCFARKQSFISQPVKGENSPKKTPNAIGLETFSRGNQVNTPIMMNAETQNDPGFPPVPTHKDAEMSDVKQDHIHPKKGGS